MNNMQYFLLIMIVVGEFASDYALNSRIEALESRANSRIFEPAEYNSSADKEINASSVDWLPFGVSEQMIESVNKDTK